MMTIIDGFSIEPHSGSSFLFQRKTRPQHEYLIKLTRAHVKLLEILPGDIAQGDPLVDAERSEDAVLKAATKYRDQLLPPDA
jgi:hypothetical protein